MEKQRFTLTFEGSGITVKGGSLEEISAHAVQPGSRISGNDLHLHLTEGFTKKDLNSSITVLVKDRSFLSFLRLKILRHLDTIMAFVLSLLVVVLIILISVHGSLTYDLISGNDKTTIFNFPGTWIFVIISLIILSMLYFFPKVIFGDYDNLLKGMLSKFSSNERQKNRFHHQVNVCLRTNRSVERIILWNPMVQGRQSWIMRQLLPVLFTLEKEMIIQIKTDEKNTFIDLFKDHGIRLASANHKDERSGAEIFPTEALPSWEKEYLAFLIFCSTLNLPERWSSGIRDEHFVSWELAEVLFTKYKEDIFNFTEDTVDIDKFIQRCLFDYGYMSENEKKDLIFHPSVDKNMLGGSQADMLRDHITPVISTVAPGLKDSLSLLILLGLIHDLDPFHPKRLHLMELFIRTTLASENYHLMSDYWKDISLVPEKDKKDKGYQFRLLQFFDIETLQILSECLQNAGMYNKALEIYEFTGNINPARAAIDRSVIEESLGEYRQSLDTLYLTEKEWLPTGAIDDVMLSLELYWNIAWVIVSGRLEEEKANGYAYLEKMNNMLKDIPDAGQHILYLARYYNTLANYQEWDVKYEAAIESYEKALKLPGQYLRKSSLLINMGISQRLLGHQEERAAEKADLYEKSLDNMRKGVEMKIAIGEKNQIPGSRHNLAETAIELAHVLEDDGRKKDILVEAHKNALAGLVLLEELKTNKKKGRLLVEKYLSEYLLGQLGGSYDLASSQKELEAWMQKEEIDSFDLREVKQMLRRFGREEI